MAKLIYSLNGSFLGEFKLDKDRFTIGRRSSNDIHIDNLIISGEHAVIKIIGRDAFLEDAGSTNGTFVNGKQIQQHILQNDDVIQLGKYQLRYLVEEAGVPAKPTKKLEKTKTDQIDAKQNNKVPAVHKPEVQPQAKPQPPPQDHASNKSPSVARVKVLTGTGKTKELLLNKTVTTLGKPGVQVAVITKRSQGYFLTHVEGQSHPLVNGKPIGVQAHALHNHDVIELAGSKMEFCLA